MFLSPFLLSLLLPGYELFVLTLFLVELADESLKVEVHLPWCLVLQLLLEYPSLYPLQLHLPCWPHALQTLPGQLTLLHNGYRP